MSEEKIEIIKKELNKLATSVRICLERETEGSPDYCFFDGKFNGICACLDLLDNIQNPKPPKSLWQKLPSVFLYYRSNGFIADEKGNKLFLLSSEPNKNNKNEFQLLLELEDSGAIKECVGGVELNGLWFHKYIKQ